MITKKDFFEFLRNYKKFESSIKRIEKAISGDEPYYNVCLFESDWYQAVDKIYDIFINSHFTELGIDLINWWMFEDVDHIIWENREADLFNGKSEIEYDVNDKVDLWNYMLKYKKDYFKNVE